ncbi:hypothetical protein BDZ89DRAFT_121288 [Hymenopellis radicata]|nr:hypothetical protein BDZ89DRAFT_121288 [Hymenopellis radicata]
MSEISRASKQSAPSHVSRQSARLRQELPAFTKDDLPQQTRRRQTQAAEDVPLPMSLDDIDDAGGIQAFQPPSRQPSRRGPSQGCRLHQPMLS